MAERMATYYRSSSNERDAMPATCPTDSLHAYPEGHALPHNMMMYLNPSPSAASYSDSVPGNYQLQLGCGELPSTGASHSTPSCQGNLSDLIGSHAGDPPYDVWRDGRNEMSFMQPVSGSISMHSIGKQLDGKNDPSHDPITEDSQMSLPTHSENLYRGPTLQGQGLSLSLSTQIPTAVPVSLFQFRSPNLGHSSFLSSYPCNSGDGTNGAISSRDQEISQSAQSGNAGFFPPGFPRENQSVIKGETNLQYMHSNRLSGLSSIIPNSKYLKVAQQLLDELVDVRKALQHECKKQESFRIGQKVSKDGNGEAKEDCGLPLATNTVPISEESNTTPAQDLSNVTSQDLQNKVSELLSMLEEVDRKYKQYYHQMQIVASYFDGIAGIGASKPYTTLALQTISRHFRCIRDTINGQIKVIRSTLGEDDTAGNTKEGGISRLRFVEQKLRQHRALQQLGMMQQHAWRPQRGLPETSVTILRAWLFEHFLHPYPKDSDKTTLARQTGLTRGQVSNWFINARVRLWKPMIEDMYKEEIGDSEIDSNSSSDNTPKAVNNTIKLSEEVGEPPQKNLNSTSTEIYHLEQFNKSKPDFTHEEIDLGEQDALFQSNAYQMAELDMFGQQGGISLTLGLQHMREDEMYNAVASTVEASNVDQDNQQYRFGSSHLLHDFVP